MSELSTYYECETVLCDYICFAWKEIEGRSAHEVGKYKTFSVVLQRRCLE